MKTPTALARSVACRCLSLLLALASISTPASAAPPTGFAVEDIATGLDQPMSLRFLPDGRMLVIQKKGQLSIGEVLGTSRDFEDYGNLTAPAHVLGLNFSNERGLLDLAIDPDFPAQPYVYLFYTPESAPGGAKARVARFTHVENAGGTSSRLDLSSEVLLWEDTDGYDSCCHFGGSVDFGPEGRLWITTGDHFQGSYASSLAHAGGKVHRINKDGSIPADNPHVDGAGPNVDSIFAHGLRNPFRARWDLVSNTFHVSEVGGNTQTTAWEDLHVIRYDAASGRFIDDDFGSPSDDGVYDGINFGWPTVEGLPPYADWPAATIDAVGAPAFAYRHGGQTAAINGGFVYHGSQFPAEYQGAYFYADSTRDFIRYLVFNPDGSVAPNPAPDPISGQNPDAWSHGFDLAPTGRIVCLDEGPDGALYYVSFTDSGGAYGQPNPSVAGAVRRYVYDGGNVRPTITGFSAEPVAGAAPLGVEFTLEAVDFNGDAMSYSLDFGDGSAPATGVLTDNTPLPVGHEYAVEGSFTARLTVGDGVLESVSTLDVEVGTPPTIVGLTAVNDNPVPEEGYFRFGDTYTFAASAEDSAGNPIPASGFSWSVSFIRPGNTHPAVGPVDGVDTIDFPVPSQGQGFSGPVYYRAFVTVTDANGLSTTGSIDIFPEKANIAFDTVPSGIVVQIDGNTSIATPFVLDTLVNYEHVITVPATDCVGSSEYLFTGWADGPATEQRSYVVPPDDTSLTAGYSLLGDCGPGNELVLDGLVVHLESDLNVGLGAGSDVATWLDQSGLGNDLEARGNPRMLAAGTPTGRPALSFDGVDDALFRLHASDPLGGLPLGNADRTLFQVVRYTGPAGAFAGVSYGSPALGQAFGLVARPNGGVLVLQGYGSTDVVSGATGVGAGWMVQSATVANGFGTMFKDGLQVAQAPRSYNTQPTRLVLGEEIGGLGHMGMELAAVLIYDRELGPEERQSVEAYLQEKYLTGPAANNAPVVAVSSPLDGAAFAVGAEVSLAATADDAEDGDLAGSIEWSSDLDGVLGSGATLAVSSLSEGTHVLTASVTDSGGLVGSDSVVITVGEAADGLPVTGGLVLRLESTDGVTQSAGQVSGWADTSGKGNSVVASGDPQFAVTSTPSGAPALSFDGTGDKLERVAASDPLSGLPAGNADRTMFVVVNYPGGSTAFAGTTFGTAAPGQAFGLGIRNGSGTLVLQGYGSTDIVSAEPGFGAGWMIQSGTVGGGFGTMFRDGIQVARAARSYDTQPAKLVMGEEIGGLGHVVMDLAAVIVYDRELSAGERLSVESYLQDKYFAAPPQNEAPVVNLASPAGGSGFALGEVIAFSATALDTEDGDLSTAIAWSSSIDGSLGSGPALALGGLSEGIHNITASVTDSGGLGDSRSVTITVGSPPTALPVTPGLALHLESALGVEAGGGAITRWNDLSGNGNHLLAAGDPQLSAATPTGQPALSLDGAGDKLERLAATDPIAGLPAGNQDRTMFVVANYPGGATAYAGAAFGSAATGRAFGLGVRPADGVLVLQGYGPVDLLSSEPGLGAGWLLHSATVGGGTATMFKDGAVIAGAARTYDTQLDKIVVAEEIGGLGSVELDVAAVIVYDRELDEGERQAVEAYLREKYLTGTPVNSAPEVAITAPADGTSVAEGVAVGFAATASDAEDGDLSAVINWTSSLDGKLGSGAAITASTLSVGTHVVTAEAVDSGSLSGTASISITVNPVGGAPLVTITSPADGAEFVAGETLSLSATATDPDASGGPGESLVLGNGFDIPGFQQVDGANANYVVNLAESYTNTTGESVEVSVDRFRFHAARVTDPLTPFLVRVDGPGDFTVVAVGDARADYVEGENDFAFVAGGKTIDLAPGGTIAPGFIDNRPDGTPGSANGAVTFVDGGDSIAYQYDVENTAVTLVEGAAPVVPLPYTIPESARFRDYFFSIAIEVGGGGDVSGSIVWSSDLDGDLGSGASIDVSSLSVGTHLITATATDGDSQTGTATLTVTIVDGNTAPVVAIASPAGGTMVAPGESINFAATADDVQDGDLSSSIAWSSDVDGPLGVGGNLSASLSTLGEHEITATVSDSGGLPGSDTITLVVEVTNAPPVVDITAPADGLSVGAGTTVTFAATADDDLDGDVSASIRWTSDLDGLLGSGGSVASSSLSTGTHVVTAEATDSASLAGSDTVTLTVVAENLAPLVDITSPANGAVIDAGEAIVFSATAVDPDGTGGSGESFVLGNGFDIPGFRQVDGANANFVVNLGEVYTNEGPSPVTLAVDRFRFHATRVTDPVTPFLVRVDGADDFTVLAVGDPRASYAVGANDVAFSATGATIEVAPGETIAPGFIDNLPDGTPGSANGAITFVGGGDAMAYRYDVENTAVTLEVGAAPVVPLPYSVPPASLFRDYFFSISLMSGGGDLAESIEWSSDLDGPLGGGSTIDVAGLSSGTHLISAVVTDDGVPPATGSDGITITVGPASLPVTDGLALQLESSEGVVTSGGTVTSWQDLSGNNRDLFAGGNPALVEGLAPSGAPAIRLDGFNDYLGRINSISPVGLPRDNEDRTVYLVARFFDSAGTNAGLVWGRDRANRTFGLVGGGDSGELILQGHGSGNNFATGAALDGEGWLVITAVHEDSGSRVLVNGVEVASFNHVFNTNRRELLIGREIDFGDFAEMDVAAVLVYERALTDSEIGQVDGYLASGYLDEELGSALVGPVYPEGYEDWLESFGLAGETEGDSDGGGLDNLDEFHLGFDPASPGDDVGFRLRLEPIESGVRVHFPALVPTGSYHLHFAEVPDETGDPASRIGSLVPETIESMDPMARENFHFDVTNLGDRGFFRLLFEPEP